MIHETLSQAADRFKRHGFESPDVEAQALLSDLLNIGRTDLYLKGKDSLDPDQESLFRKFVDRRLTREPAAYIVGRKAFLDHDFAVDLRCLIPRPETEVLVQLISAELDKNPTARVWDVGTGSGCIAVSLALKFPTSFVMATDVSAEALEVAKKNAKRLKTSQNISFSIGDVFAGRAPEKDGDFDMIVSNPPYIATQHLSQLDPDLSYEPRLALDGGSQGLDVIQKIISGSENYLKPRGLLFLEIGFDQGNAVRELMQKAGFTSVEIKKDDQGLDRIAKGEWSGSI